MNGSTGFGALYLADAKGQVFKRANPDEAASLPTVTGVERDLYLSDPDAARAQIREAVTVVEAWRAVKARPPLGEVHLDRLNGATLYTATGGVGVRLGRVEETLPARLQRFDAVWAALDEARARLSPALPVLKIETAYPGEAARGLLS